MLTALKTLLSPSSTLDAPATTSSAEDAAVQLRHAIQDAWKVAARARTTSAAAHAAYTLLRGRDLHRAFSPITNPQKIVSNGNDPHWGLNRALNELRLRQPQAFAPWSELLQGVPKDARGRYTGKHPLFDTIDQALARHTSA